nr:hypothetical protein [Tanacetum cinerariifolium]
DLPVPDLRTMEELWQPSLNGRGGPIAPIAIQATNFGLKNDMIQQSIKVNGVTDDALRCISFLIPSHIMPPLGGTFMKRLLEECYDLIENMTVTTMIGTLQPNGVNQKVKAVTLNCETCGGPHSFSDCPVTIGNTQNVYAAGSYQDNSYQPQGNRNLLNYRSDNNLGPQGFNQNQNCNNQNHNFQNQNRNQENHNPQGNNQGRNQFFQGANQGHNQPSAYLAPAYQAPVYQAPVHQPQIPQPQVVTTNDFTNFMKANDEDLKGITTRSGTAYQGPTIPTTSSPPVVEHETEEIKDMVHLTNNKSIKYVQPSVVPTESPILSSELVISPITKPVASP